MTSLKEKLYTIIKEQKYLSYGEMCQRVAELGYKVDTATRELRHLHEEGKIDNEIKKSRRNTDYISGYYIGERKESTIKYIPITYPDGTTAVRQVME